MEVVNLIRALTEGISVGFIASIPLGPIGVLCIQRTLNNGRRSGFASGAGAASSDFVYAVVAGFSISMITDFIDEHRNILLGIGAMVLILLGLKMMLTKPENEEKQMNKAPRGKSGLWQDYVSTFFLTITNPLALFVFIGAFSLMGIHGTPMERYAVVGGVLIGALLWWLSLTMLVGYFRKKLTVRRLLYINRIAGAAIVALVIISLIVETVDYLTA